LKEKVSVWLITQGEPSPIDEGNPRLHRTGLLFKFFEQSGHQVIWFNSTFNHFTKKQRFDKTTILPSGNNSWLVFLKARGYKRNISIQRILDHIDLGEEFSRCKSKFTVPDIIVSAYPTYELCHEALKYSKKYNIPLLIDYRDKWPEVFFDILPKWLRNISRIPFFPLFYSVNRLFSRVDGLIGMSDPFLDLALKKAKRSRKSNDAVFPFGYLSVTDNIFFDGKENQFWDDLDVLQNENLKICFFGAIGKMFDFDTIISTAMNLEIVSRKITFIICGSGEKLESLKIKAKGYNNIIFPGFISANQIMTLMQRCHIGISPYLANEGFLESLPNKIIEYLAGGLPVITSLENSYHGRIILENSLGFSYKIGKSAELINLFVRLDQNRELVKSYAQNAYKFFYNNFKAEIVYQNYINHILNVQQTYHSKITNKMEPLK